MWIKCNDGLRLFRHGRENFNAAAQAAGSCTSFRADVEEEWVTDESRSCYNCRYRRWTADSFVCQAAP